MKTLIPILFVLLFISCEKTPQLFCWDCYIENTVTKTMPTGQSDTEVINSVTFKCNMSEADADKYEDERGLTSTYYYGTVLVHNVKICTCVKQ